MAKKLIESTMIFVLIPVFNEAPNIPELAASLLSVLSNGENHFVFVDDCSTDDTVNIIVKHFPIDKLSILKNPTNSGPGYSFNGGFEYILAQSKSSDDLIVTMEGDNTSDLRILPLMISLCSLWGFDLTLASVYAQGGGFQKTTLLRKVISFVANQLLRTIYDIKLLTLSSFFRVYKISLVRAIKKENEIIISESGFICALEILVKSIRVNARIIEVPMVLNSLKRKGESKMKIIKTSISYLKFLFKNAMK